MNLRNKAKNRLPASVEEAYRTLNGSLTGDVGGAKIFLDSMQDTERRVRGRGEQREVSKLRMFSRQGYPSLLSKVKNGKLIR